jgi:hypothetical protein
VIEAVVSDMVFGKDDDGDDSSSPNGQDFDITQVASEADEERVPAAHLLYSWFDNGQPCAIGVHHGTETDHIVLFDDSHGSYSVNLAVRLPI